MDWVDFFDAQGIAYVTSGPNTKRGNISIKCPWCGDDDPSEHLSISLSKDAYGCWRNAQHAGRRPYSLVAALLNCSFTQAKLIAQQFSTPDPESLEAAVTALDGAVAPMQQPIAPQQLSPAFKPIKQVGLTRRFWRYLERRGFDNVGKLVDRYELLCAQTGEQKDRIIIPLYSNERLVGWTGRAIQHTISAPRYLSSGPQVKEIIFNEDDLTGGQCLFITEGPFDALKVDFYGCQQQARATCLFGVIPTMAQIGMLRKVIPRFAHVAILFDAAAVQEAFVLSEYFMPGVQIVSLPPGAKDPGELTKKQVQNMAAAMLAY